MEGQEDLQSPSVYLRVVLPTAIFKCYHSKQFFYIHHTNLPSAVSKKKNGFEQHKPMFTAPILNSNLNAANLISIRGNDLQSGKSQTCGCGCAISRGAKKIEEILLKENINFVA